jgi:hypothetical protein
MSFHKKINSIQTVLNYQFVNFYFCSNIFSIHILTAHKNFIQIYVVYFFISEIFIQIHFLSSKFRSFCNFKNKNMNKYNIILMFFLIMAMSNSTLGKSHLFFMPGLTDYFSCNQMHLIKDGESCQSIAAKYGMTLHYLKWNNPKLICKHLHPGKHLCINKPV